MTGYGVFAPPGEKPRVGFRAGDSVLDLSALGEEFAASGLNAFMAAGPEAWHTTLARIEAGEADAATFPLADVELRLPFEPADYVDFYSSLEHATNMGRMFRPDSEPLLANWRHLPIGYHGRAGTIVVSGTPIRRPSGQAKPPDAAQPLFGPSGELDIELELGFVVGVGSRLGEPVPTERFEEHVFGVVLVNDWSARDLQAWEYQPLGPFLGKSFATSISAWVTPLAALEGARVPRPAAGPGAPALPPGRERLDARSRARRGAERRRHRAHELPSASTGACPSSWLTRPSTARASAPET